MSALLPFITPRFWNKTNPTIPLNNGYLVFKVGGTGQNGEDKPVYTTSDLDVAHPNPIQLNMVGEPPGLIWLAPGTYDIYLYDENYITDPSGSLQWSAEGVSGVQEASLIRVDTRQLARGIDINQNENALICIPGEYDEDGSENRIYYYDPANSEADDDDKILKPSSVTGDGRWVTFVEKSGSVVGDYVLRDGSDQGFDTAATPFQVGFQFGKNLQPFPGQPAGNYLQTTIERGPYAGWVRAQGEGIVENQLDWYFYHGWNESGGAVARTVLQRLQVNRRAGQVDPSIDIISNTLSLGTDGNQNQCDPTDSTSGPGETAAAEYLQAVKIDFSKGVSFLNWDTTDNVKSGTLPLPPSLDGLRDLLIISSNMNNIPDNSGPGTYQLLRQLADDNKNSASSFNIAEDNISTRFIRRKIDTSLAQAFRTVQALENQQSSANYVAIHDILQDYLGQYGATLFNYNFKVAEADLPGVANRSTFYGTVSGVESLWHKDDTGNYINLLAAQENTLNMSKTTPFNPESGGNFVINANESYSQDFIAEDTGVLSIAVMNIVTSPTVDNTVEIGVYDFLNQLVGKASVTMFQGATGTIQFDISAGEIPITKGTQYRFAIANGASSGFTIGASFTTTQNRGYFNGSATLPSSYPTANPTNRVFFAGLY